ncbi:MAG: hypothetical protein KBT01_00745 [Clostridiales bacterium]|nr:hypothetical protein [Candidatus Blautia equi]
MHSSKKIFRFIAVICVFAIAIWGLDFLLYPCTFIRNDLHAVLEEPMDDVYLGTSHGRMNIDPDKVGEITGTKGHVLAVGGEYAIDAYYMTKLMIEKQKPKRIIYEVSPGYFMTEKEEGNNYLLFYHEFPLSMAKLEYFKAALFKTNFRTMLFPWYEYPLDYELGRISKTVFQKWNHNYDPAYLKSSTQEYHENGFIERYPVDTTTMAKDKITSFDEAKIKTTNMEYLDKLVTLCRDNDIEFIAVTTPMPLDSLIEYEEEFKAAWKYFGSFFAERDVQYFNFNVELFQAFPHDLELFTDYDGHMNGDAAREFSTVLGKVFMANRRD